MLSEVCNTIILFCNTINSLQYYYIIHKYYQESETWANFKEALYTTLRLWMHRKRSTSYVSPERPPRSLGGLSWSQDEVFMTLDVNNFITREEELCNLGEVKVKNSYNGIGRERGRSTKNKLKIRIFYVSNAMG